MTPSDRVRGSKDPGPAHDYRVEVIRCLAILALLLGAGFGEIGLVQQVLEESHGISGPSGPRLYAADVPYPSKSNNAFTPYTVPSSRSQLGEGTPVHITNIRKLADGRITFWIGWEFF